MLNISFNSEFLPILLAMPFERESSLFIVRVYLFVGWAGVFIAVWGFSLVVVRGLVCSCGSWGSCCRAQFVGRRASVDVTSGL